MRVSAVLLFIISLHAIDFLQASIKLHRYYMQEIIWNYITNMYYVHKKFQRISCNLLLYHIVLSFYFFLFRY